VKKIPALSLTAYFEGRGIIEKSKAKQSKADKVFENQRTTNKKNRQQLFLQILQ